MLAPAGIDGSDEAVHKASRPKSSSQVTLCWSKGDSNYQSHRERSGHGRARTNHGHHARSQLIRPPSLFGNAWDQEFESPLLQREVGCELDFLAERVTTLEIHVICYPSQSHYTIHLPLSRKRWPEG